ncbi:MAG TPA: N-acetyltransferase [Advenella sp.]|nr:N-acetyltransferase [Advenella sp.]
MRFDVSISNEQIEQELADMQARMARGRHALGNLPLMQMQFPDMEFRVRKIAREQRVYAIDTRTGLLVGYSVFDILPEGSRRLHSTVRSVHSRYAAPYQGRGIASALYTKVLSDGFVLVSGARQSRAAYALWKSLGRRMRFDVVKITPETIEPLKISERDNRFHDLDVRLQLCAP